MNSVLKSGSVQFFSVLGLNCNYNQFIYFYQVLKTGLTQKICFSIMWIVLDCFVKV